MNVRAEFLQLLLVLAVAAGLGPPRAMAQGAGAGAVESPRVVAPFSLTGPSGQTVSSGQFRGEFMLVYFGYTHCPDVCPLDLLVISVMMEELSAPALQLHPLFITVDPERDTPEVLAGFMAYFHPGIVGLTGTLEEVRAAAAAFGATFAKSLILPGPGELEYFMTHTASLSLVGPDGRILEVYPSGTHPDVLIESIRSHIAGNAAAPRP